MSIFNGTDVHDWVYHVERYFFVNGLTEPEQSTAVTLFLEGRALTWYRWRDQLQPLRSWKEFKDSIMERFRPTYEGILNEQFFALTQVGTVM